jgi:hypothetical protein
VLPQVSQSSPPLDHIRSPDRRQPSARSRIAAHESPLPSVAKSSQSVTRNFANGHQRACTTVRNKERIKMLWTIAVILFVLWALGMVTAYSASGLIHILLVLAIVVVLIRVIQGRRAI